MTCWSSGANAGLTYRMAFCLFYSIHALKKRIYDLIVYTMSRNIDRFCALYGCFALLVFVHLPACMHVFLHVLVSILVAFLSSEFLYLRPSLPSFQCPPLHPRLLHACLHSYSAGYGARDSSREAELWGASLGDLLHRPIASLAITITEPRL